jgi:hypothetical protein
MTMSAPIDLRSFGWWHRQGITPFSYTCGHCGNVVSSEKGYKLGQYQDGSGTQVAALYICPHCGCPTYQDGSGGLLPDAPFGSSVSDVPEDIATLYEEARQCTSAGSYTACVLIGRKLLMHIGVEKGAEENKPFLYYVDHLANQGYVPPNGKHWVDHIRRKGNEANHEIRVMGKDDAKELLIFLEMLLRFIYEFPSMIPDESIDAG